MHLKGLMKAEKKNIQTEVIANNGRGLQQRWSLSHRAARNGQQGGIRSARSATVAATRNNPLRQVAIGEDQLACWEGL